MLNLIETNFSNNEINNVNIKKSAIATLSATLSGIGLSSASATIIKGSLYNKKICYKIKQSLLQFI